MSKLLDKVLFFSFSILGFLIYEVFNLVRL